jgi:hypothetical protein
MATTLNASQNYSYLAITAFFGFLGFMMQPTAYTWGEQDMMPFFERVFDPNFLTNDFFTNTTEAKNPRWVYGYFIVALSWITTLPWYKILYIFKLLLLTLMPVLYFKVLVLLLRRFVSEKALSRLAPFVLICLVLMVFLKEYRLYFSVASWLGYYPGLSAHNVSIAICFAGILLKEAKRSKIGHLPFFFLSALVHPAMGLFGVLFYALFLVPEFKKEVKAFLPILVSTLLAVVLVKLVFASEQTLPASEFIDMYVKERHPWHYSVPDFKNLKGDWVIFFVLMNLLFIIPFLYGLWHKRRAVWLLSLCTWVSYSGAIAVQYFFIDVMPVKLIAYLGVSRFTTFGYWMLVIIWAILLADRLKKEQALVFPSLSVKNFAILIINLIFVGIVFIDNPREVHYNNRKAYYDFVQSTPKDAIFTTYSRTLNTDMRIIGRRGVFISDEFPFTEEFIVEYTERRKSMYGSLQKDSNGIDFYRELRPKDFIEISKKYQLDYILIENGFETEFANNTPVWKNNKHSLYSVKRLRE